MSSIISRDTLHLSPSKLSPLVRGLILFLITIPIVIAFVEIAARTPLGNRFPAPSTEADSFIFDKKLYLLETQFRRDGAIDCIFIGSSIANADVDPAVIEKIYREQTGETLRCFNFGFPAMTIENATALGEAVIARFHPKVLIYPILSRDVDHVAASADFIEESIWTRTQRGQDASFKGWLVDRSYAYRWYLAWRYWLNVPNRVKMQTETSSLSPQGFQPAAGINEPYPQNLTMTPKRLAEMWVVPSRVKALNRFFALQKAGTRLVLLEGPVYYDPADATSLSAKTAYEEKYIAPMKEMAETQGILFLRTDSIAAQIPKPHWYDWLHLNNEGAAAFSQWLGEQLAENKWLFE
jgi:hypothetical protein